MYLSNGVELGCATAAQASVRARRCSPHHGRRRLGSVGRHAARDDAYIDADRDLRYPWRQQLFEFTVEHDVAQGIDMQHEKGLKAPTWSVICAILRLWSALPQSVSTSKRLGRLADCGVTSNNFMRLFRATQIDVVTRRIVVPLPFNRREICAGKNNPSSLCFCSFAPEAEVTLYIGK